MKNLIFACCLICCVGFNAQTDIYSRLKELIKKTHPEINTDNKLLAFNIWSVNDAESREANKSFEKAYSVYEYAKLKGGLQGIVVIAINKDNLTSMAVITATKDGIHKLTSVKLDDLKDPGIQNKNMVFDSQGNEIYRNLPHSEIFESIHQLITR